METQWNDQHRAQQRAKLKVVVGKLEEIQALPETHNHTREAKVWGEKEKVEQQPFRCSINYNTHWKEWYLLFMISYQRNFCLRRTKSDRSLGRNVQRNSERFANASPSSSVLLHTTLCCLCHYWCECEKWDGHAGVKRSYVKVWSVDVGLSILTTTKGKLSPSSQNFTSSF